MTNDNESLSEIFKNLFESLTPVETELGPVDAESIKKLKELDARADQLNEQFDKKRKELHDEFEKFFIALDEELQVIWDGVYNEYGIIEDEQPEGTKFAITDENILVRLDEPVKPVGPIQ